MRWGSWRELVARYPIRGYGNGRTGRLLISVLLQLWGLRPQPLLYLSAFLEHHRDEYIDLLFAVRARGAWKEWVAFFLEGVAEQARDAATRAQSLWELRETWREGAGARRSQAMMPLIDSLFSNPVLTTTTAAARLQLGYQAVHDSVKRLADRGILHAGPRASYGQVYYADAILQIVGAAST